MCLLANINIIGPALDNDIEVLTLALLSGA
jgi:hypothetical protein